MKNYYTTAFVSAIAFMGIGATSIAVQAQNMATNLRNSQSNKQNAMPAPLFLQQRNAQIVDQKKIEGGLTMLDVKLADGKRGVFFITPDNQVLIVGTIFNANTGQNLSDKYMLSQQPNLNNNARPVEQSSTEAGQDPVIHLRQILKGVTEGKGIASAAPNVFVFFDPLCIFCQSLYKNTRDLIKRGATIKWIPIEALPQSAPLSATFLRMGVAGLSPMAAKKITPSVPTAEDKNALQANMLMATALANTVGKRVATPMIVYVDSNKKLGVEFGDGSSAAELKKIFWEIK